ncbi:MAG: sigma-70 family RNA polymerase sigma factor [Phycisphaerales bacterium]|nr:sigma-70 family RNA polymerase sigma factor [Phycisphaerales bacterium]MBT7171211.1 sigma-70 family RNA polymerase sigma factor [Phycisphaerales bacterium]
MSQAPQHPRTNPHDDPNVQLMLRIRNGDDEAFTELVQINTPAVHAMVYRFLRNSQLVEDITQEVFLRIYRNAKRYEPKAKFTTWLYRIVANLCFNTTRKKKLATVSIDSFGKGEDAGSFDPEMPADLSPDKALKTRELQQDIETAIGQLPKNQQTAILLNKYENLSYDQIGDILELSTMAVKSLLSRARKNLRYSLRKHAPHRADSKKDGPS